MVKRGRLKEKDNDDVLTTLYIYSSVIEEELEVLYDAYYEELEKYACRQQFQQQQQQQEEEDTSSDDDMEEESCCSSSSDEEVGIKIKNTLTVKGEMKHHIFPP